MKLRNLLVGLTLTSAMALLAAPAGAADMYVPGPGLKDGPVWSPTWAGFYIGANAGYAWSDTSVSAPTGYNGSFLGAQAGYNWQHGSFVFGVETDIQGGGNNIRNFTGSDPTINDFGTVRGRAGYAFGPILAYVTGGFAYGDVVLSGLTFQTTGYALGGGIEYKLAPSWSVKAEYQYVDLGSETVGSFTEDFRTNTVKVGINYFLGTYDYAPLK